MKKITITGVAMLACLVSFNGLFSAANGQESMEEINRRYQAAQGLQFASQSPQSSGSSSSSSFDSSTSALSDDPLTGSSSTTLFDDAGERKRTERNQNENENQDEAPKFQRIIEDPAELVAESDRLHQAHYLEELKRALNAKNETAIRKAIDQFFLYSSNKTQARQLVGALPELRTFITEKLLAKNYTAIKPLYQLLPVDLQNDVILKKTGKNADDFKKFMYQKLNAGDFRAVHPLVWLLPQNLHTQFVIKIKGNDNRIIYLDPYVATRYSNTLKNLFVPEIFAITGGFEHEPLNLGHLQAPALRKLVQLFRKVYATQGLNNALTFKNFITQLIISGFFANETPESFKDLFEAASFLDVVPGIKGILIDGALATIRQQYNSDFDLFNNLPEEDKKLIALRSFISRPSFRFLRHTEPQEQYDKEKLNYQKEDTWRRNFTFSVGDYAPYVQNHFIETTLSHRNIASLEGISAIPNVANTHWLNLEGNRLSSLPADGFSRGLTNLRRLNLSNNQLQTIHPDAFRGLTNLQELTLSDNPLQEIDLNIFNHLPQLITVVLRETPLVNKTSLHARIRNKVEQVTGRRPRILVK